MKLALACLGCAVVALLVGLWIGGAKPEIAATSSVPSSEVTDEMRAILEELRGIRAELKVSSSSLAPESPRTPVTKTAPDTASLERTVAELTEAVKAMGAGSARSSAIGLAHKTAAAVGFDSIQAFCAAGAGAGTYRKHSFWTVQEVRDRYGEPTFIAVYDGKLALVYSYQTQDGKSHEARFEFFDGFVINAYGE